jgi:putative oxidoreductase
MTSYVDARRQYVGRQRAGSLNGHTLLNQLLRTESEPVPALLRVTIALIMFPHGAQHLLGWFGGYGFAGTHGWMVSTLGIPSIFATVAILTEFFAPLALLLGIGGRIAALGIATLMTVAASTHVQHGFFMNWVGAMPAGGEGFEYHVLVVAMSVAICVQGSGAWSIDRRITGADERRRTG